VRGYFGGIYYDWNGGRIKREGRLEVPLQGQGESVTYSTDGTRLLYGSEGEDSPVQAEPAPGGGGGGTSKPSSGGGASGTQASGGSGGGISGELKTGGVVVLVAAVAVFGLGRMLRRRS
jgi:hypothetical protein